MQRPRRAANVAFVARTKGPRIVAGKTIGGFCVAALEVWWGRAYARIDIEEDVMKIGKLVQHYAPAIFAYCETKDADEFTRLQDPHYSKENLDINYPFCKPVAHIGAEDHVRYYKQVYTVFDVPVRVTSQWFNPTTSRSLPLLQKYVQSLGIHFDADADVEVAEVVPVERKPRGRYKSPALGNGQNAVIRYILGQLGEEQFNAADWERVKADFDHACAYCGSEGELQMDHAIPINRTALGEHRLGNLVPACRGCNATKSGKDFRAFLADAPARIATIEAHMAKYGYTPIGDHKMLKSTLEMAHADVRHLADRYVMLIETMLQCEREA
jgi:5-methylcytosine-specific restriction endonuclease McrA